MEDSAFGRIVSVLTNPTKTFESIRQRPTWLAVMAALILAVVLTGHLAGTKVDWQGAAREAIDSSPQAQQLTGEEREQRADSAASFMRYGNTIAPVLVIPIFTLIGAGVLLVVVNVMGGQMTFVQSLSTSLHSAVPQIVARLLWLPVIFTRDSIDALELQGNSVLKSNLGAFAGEETAPALRALMASIDVFGLWGVALSAIGVAVVGRLSKGTGILIAVGLWVFWTLVGAGLASLAPG